MILHNKIQQLLAKNKGRGQFRSETSGSEATLYLYDVIVSDDSWGGVSALTFAKELNSLDAKTIHIRLDSPGGEVFAAISMATAMREHKSEIVVHVDGYAASAATQLLMAADKSVISQGGMVMIHKAWTLAMGNSSDMTSTAALLDKIDGQIAESYTNKTGIPADEILQMMDDETWMTEKEAVEKGFVDAIAETKKAKNQAKWDLSAYCKPPEPAEQEPDPPDNNNTDEPANGSDQIGAVSVSDPREKLLLKLKITEAASY